MNALAEIARKETAARARADLERRGFEVIVGPEAKDLPNFLADYAPDMIGLKGAEGVVVGIKTSPPSDEDNRRAAYFASEVPKHPGWRFNLFVAEPRQELIDAPLEPSRRQLLADLQVVTDIAERHGPNPALAYAWGLLEAVARQLSLSERRGKGRRYKPASVVEILVSDGFIDDARGNELFALGRVRNQIVHGFTRAEISKQQIKLLIDTIAALITEIPDDDR